MLSECGYFEQILLHVENCVNAATVLDWPANEFVYYKFLPE